MAGILIISFNGKELEIKPIGDILAVAAALVWAIYSLLTRKISSYGYNTIQTTKRVFAYGIVFMIPTLFFFEFNLDLARMANIKYLFNLIFLGLGASALCFVTWNYNVLARNNQASAFCYPPKSSKISAVQQHLFSISISGNSGVVCATFSR